MNTPNNPEPVRVGKSLDEIASILAQNTIERQRARGVSTPNEVTDETGNNGADDDDDLDIGTGGADQRPNLPQGDEDGDDPAPVEDADDGEVEPGSDDDEEGVDGPLTDDDGFEIDDDTLIEFDGDETVSLADLKKAYSADKTIVKLVEEREQAVVEARTERAKASEDSAKARRAMEAVFQHFDRIVAQPLIPKPDERLKETNPAQYIRHFDAYQQDQARITNTRQQLLQAFDAHAQSEKELFENRKAHELALLTEKIPALKDPDVKKRSQASQDILDAASHYGFSPEEVNSAADSRIYQMAYDAQQYRKIMSKSSKTVEDVKEKATTKVKGQTGTLRSRGTTAKHRLTAQASKIKVLKAKARKTGKAEDIAGLIAAKRST